MFASLMPFVLKADYHLERITPVLNQPTFVTQAPGDPTNILYYSTRISTTNSGTGLNQMGKVWRYDVATRTSTPVLDMGVFALTLDDGLECMAFHPDFNTSNSAGYGKIYVSFSVNASAAINFVEEFTLLNTNGTFKTTNQAFGTMRVILRYTNSAMNNHTVGWIGFNPTATNAERNYLYISTGDGSYGNSYNGGSGVNGRPSQNPNDIKGKILRVDISGLDDYPLDANKNFAIPPSNPIPAWNAANPGNPIPGLGEVYVTGLRNGYRVSFDRATGDIYWGDVGEDSYEEMNFLKAGTTVPGPPHDFGWPQYEGMHIATVGAPHTTTNPFFTNIVAPITNPLQEWPAAVGEAAIGGYVYRGPITELQGKYIYADFVTGKIWTLDFDRNSDPATFNGSNGIRADVTGLWNGMVVDTTSNAYRGDLAIGTLNGLDHVVSFGEDNDGNLYVVDFGFGSLFDGQYTSKAGEIYKLVPGPTPPPDLSMVVTNHTLKFTWPGFSFKLQAQTNGLDPNGWADYPFGGTGPVTVPLDNTPQSVFFKLKWKF